MNRTDSPSDSVSCGPFEEFVLSSWSERCSPSLERGSTSSSLRVGSWLLRSSPLSERERSFALDGWRCPSVSAEFFVVIMRGRLVVLLESDSCGWREDILSL